MIDDKKVKDVMSGIEEYDTVDLEDNLSDALKILKRNHEKIESGEVGPLHKTLFVTDEFKKIVGKLSVYDLIRGLVPPEAKKPEFSKPYYALLSSRALTVADEIGEMKERFQWLHTSFSDLVKAESAKKVKDVMSVIHPLLTEEDNLSKAIYIMFKENIRQPMVVRNGEVVGVINFMDIFPVLLEIAL